MKVKKSLSSQYMNISLITFGVLGLDMISGIIGQMLQGKISGEKLASGTSWYITIFQLILTISFWSIGIVMISKWLKKNKVLDNDMFKVNKSTIITGLLAVASWFLIYMLDGSYIFPKFIHEYKNLLNNYGSKYALIISILQNVYYVLETILVIIMIVLIQKAGEIKFRLVNVPWGGIGLAITWGMVHFISHPEGAIVVPIASVFYGLVYVAGKKKIIPLALAVWLPFFL